MVLLERLDGDGQIQTITDRLRKFGQKLSYSALHHRRF